MSDPQTDYIDGFVFPIPSVHLSEYKQIAEQVAEIWREYGALAYYEYVGEDLTLAGTRSFVEAVDAKEDEVIVFGWVVFPSKETRDSANAHVPNDPRMAALVTPLIQSERMIFDASRMMYGGFQPLVRSIGKHG
ncbi:MAG: DUF1428 domain-containing protein [Leptolyngbya sp. SIO3F4]|nr:DUF1428 domain-containing protein [Leptolyngbya sp. SIO3F4]